MNSTYDWEEMITARGSGGQHISIGESTDLQSMDCRFESHCWWSRSLRTGAPHSKLLAISFRLPQSLGLYMDVRWRNPSSIIHAVMTNENCVAATASNRVRHEIFVQPSSRFASFYFKVQVRGKLTASHANNPANVRYLHRDSAWGPEDIWAVSTLDRQSLAATPCGLLSLTRLIIDQGFVDEHLYINPGIETWRS